MKKFLKNLFSGYLLVIFILLLELAALIAIQFFQEDLVNYILSKTENLTIKGVVTLAYLLLRLSIFIISLIIFFRVINREEDPEFKIPWIVGMLLMPLFTSVLFMIFGRNNVSRKDRKNIKKFKEAYSPMFELNKRTRTKYENELGNALGTFRYINNITGLGVHKNQRITYYKNGKEFFPELIESLKKAKEFIFIEYFIISDGEIWNQVKDVLIEKAKEGVDIRLIYDDMGCSGTIPGNTPKIFKALGIKCYKFHPFRPILSGVYNNRDHRKIVIIDHEMAFTGGMNLGDDYANIEIRFGYWKDTMVKIEGSAINNLIVTFLANLNLCTGEVCDSEKFLNYDYPKFVDEGFVMPFGDGPGSIDDALIGEQNYINIINYAKKRIDISTPYLIPTYQLLDSLRNAALRGVEVNLIVPGIPDKKIPYALAKSNFHFLLEAGVNIYLYTPGFNHMKTVIADNELAFVGTINFDFRSLVHHFECGTILYKCNCMDQITADFDEMISSSIKVPKDFKLKKSTRRLCNLLKIISPLF